MKMLNLLRFGALVCLLSLTACDTIVGSADYLHNSLVQNIDPQWRGGANCATIVVVTNVVVVTNMDHSLPR